MKNIGLNRQGNRSRAFTLLEIMLVLLIIGMIAGFVSVFVAGQQESAKKDAAAIQIKGFMNIVQIYNMHMGRYPSSLQDLVQEPAGAKGRWKGPYMEKIPQDPWGRDYVYQQQGSRNKYGPDISSAGPNGSPGDADDVTN